MGGVVGLALGLQVLLDLVVHHVGGHVEGDLGPQVLQQGVAGGDGLVLGPALDHLLAQVLEHPLHRVELGGDRGEVVVDLGQLALLDGLDVDGDRGLLALVLAARQGGGEHGGLPGPEPLQGGIQPLEHIALADLVGDAGGAVHLLAVDDGLEADGDEVAGAGLAVDGLERAEAGAQVLQLGVDVLVGDLDGVDGDLGAGQIGQVDLGADRDLGGEDEPPALGAGDVGQLGDLHLGLDHRRAPGLLDGLAVEVGELLVDGLLDDGGAAHAPVDDLVGDVPAAEAGDLDLGADLLVGGVQAGLELLVGDLDGQLDARGVKVLDSALHGGLLRCMDAGEAHGARRRPDGRRSVASIRAILGHGPFDSENEARHRRVPRSRRGPGRTADRTALGQRPRGNAPPRRRAVPPADA